MYVGTYDICMYLLYLYGWMDVHMHVCMYHFFAFGAILAYRCTSISIWVVCVNSCMYDSLANIVLEVTTESKDVNTFYYLFM